MPGLLGAPLSGCSPEWGWRRGAADRSQSVQGTVVFFRHALKTCELAAAVAARCVYREERRSSDDAGGPTDDTFLREYKRFVMTGKMRRHAR